MIGVIHKAFNRRDNAVCAIKTVPIGNGRQDDLFLLEAVKKSPYKVVSQTLSHDSAVLTKPVTKLKELIHQKRRWAGKISRIKDKQIITVGVITMLGHIAVILSLYFGIYFKEYQFLLLPIIKWSLEWLGIVLLAVFGRQIGVSLLSSLVVPLYSFYALIMAILAMVPGYEWKGRKWQR